MTISKKSIISSVIILLIILFIILSQKSHAASLTSWKIGETVEEGETLEFSGFEKDVFSNAFGYGRFYADDVSYAADNGKIYFVENLTADNDKENAYITAQRLKIYDCNTKEVSVTYFYNDISVDNICVSNGKLVFFYSKDTIPSGLNLEPGQRVPESKIIKTHCASIAKEDGTILRAIDLSKLYSECGDSIKDDKVYYDGTSDRYIGVGTDGRIAVVNRFGQMLVLFEEYKNKKVEYLFSTKEGIPVFKCNQNSSATDIFYINDKDIKVLYSGTNLYLNSVIETADGNLIYRTNSDGTFVKWNIETGERKKICEYNPDYITNSLITINDAGELFVFKEEDLRIFSETNIKTTVVKVLQYELWDPNISAAMKRYEASHPGVKFEFVDAVADMDEKERFDSTIENLSNGTGADLVSINIHSFDAFYNAGCIKDLSDILSEEERANMFDCFLDAASRDGKMYMFPSFYGRKTLVAKKGLLSTPSYTATDLMLLLEKKEKAGKTYKALCYGVGGVIDPFFVFSAAMDKSEFIDWENGTCSFDSDEFVRILKQCSKYHNMTLSTPSNTEARCKALINDEVLFVELGDMPLNEFNDYKEVCGEDAVIVGFPTTAESGNITSYSRALVVGKKTKNYEVIKDFLNYLCKYYYSESLTNTYPTCKDYYDGAVVKGTGSNETSKYKTEWESADLTEGFVERYIVAIWSNPSLRVDKHGYISLPGKKDGSSFMDEFMEFYEGLRIYDKRFNAIRAIMDEEVQSMYQKNTDAQKTAKAIQERVSEYLENLD